MAVPKRKISNSRRKQRRNHHAHTSKGLSNCPNCDNIKLPHRVCTHCGHYKSVEVITANEE